MTPGLSKDNVPHSNTPSFQMGLGEHIQKYSENDDSYLHVIDDYDSTITCHNGAPRKMSHGVPGGHPKVKTDAERKDNSYDIFVIYSETPDYDSLHPRLRNTSSVESSVPALPPVPKSTQMQAVKTEQKSCCRKPLCLWGLLTVAITVVTIVLLVVFFTSLGLYTYLSHASCIEVKDL